MRHRTRTELEAGLVEICRAPKEAGELLWIVRRPEPGKREVLEEARLDLAEGLVGDNWSTRGSSKTADGSAHPEKQLTVTSARAFALLTDGREQWALSGDQLFVDLDLGDSNLPPGTHLALGSAVIEVTRQPHTGCKKFARRFGQEALRFFQSPAVRDLRLRGINARVVRPGILRVGELVRKV